MDSNSRRGSIPILHPYTQDSSHNLGLRFGCSVGVVKCSPLCCTVAVAWLVLPRQVMFRFSPAVRSPACLLAFAPSRPPRLPALSLACLPALRRLPPRLGYRASFCHVGCRGGFPRLRHPGDSRQFFQHSALVQYMGQCCIDLRAQHVRTENAYN